MSHSGGRADGQTSGSTRPYARPRRPTAILRPSVSCGRRPTAQEPATTRKEYRPPVPLHHRRLPLGVQPLSGITVAESTAPVTGHKLTLLEYTGFQYMLRVPEFLVGGVFTPPKTDSIPLTLVPKSGLVHAASRHIGTRFSPEKEMCD